MNQDKWFEKFDRCDLPQFISYFNKWVVDFSWYRDVFWGMDVITRHNLWIKFYDIVQERFSYWQSAISIISQIRSQIKVEVENVCSGNPYVDKDELYDIIICICATYISEMHYFQSARNIEFENALKDTPNKIDKDIL